MNSTGPLNPRPWQDDARQRIVDVPVPSGGLCAVLRQTYSPAPIPEDLACLLAQLR